MSLQMRLVALFLWSIFMLIAISPEAAGQCAGSSKLLPTTPAQPVINVTPLGVIITPMEFNLESGEPVLLTPEGSEAVPVTPATQEATSDSFKDAVAQLNFPPKTVDRVIQAKQTMLLDPPVKPAEDAEVGE